MKMLLRIRLCINEGNTKNENVLWKMDHDRVTILTAFTPVQDSVGILFILYIMTM